MDIIWRRKVALYLGTTTAGLQQAQYSLTNSDTTTPEFTIKLSELFPMMRNVQLPLYVINEREASRPPALAQSARRATAQPRQIVALIPMLPRHCRPPCRTPRVDCF